MAPEKFSPLSKLTKNVKLLKNPKENKIEKRAREIPLEEDEDFNHLIQQSQRSVKKSKIDLQTEAQDGCKKYIVEFFEQQQTIRKQSFDNIFQSIAETKCQIQTAYDAMKENELIQEQFMRTSIKCIRQASAVYKARLDTLVELECTLKKRYDEMDIEHNQEVNNLLDNLVNDIKKLEDKFYKDAKRRSWDFLRQNISNAMENDDL